MVWPLLQHNKVNVVVQMPVLWHSCCVSLGAVLHHGGCCTVPSAVTKAEWWPRGLFYCLNQKQNRKKAKQNYGNAGFAGRINASQTVVEQGWYLLQCPAKGQCSCRPCPRCSPHRGLCPTCSRQPVLTEIVDDVWVCCESSSQWSFFICWLFTFACFIFVPFLLLFLPVKFYVTCLSWYEW